MTDRELEQRLRAWYRDGVGEDETAPAELRERVVAIPVPAPTPLRPLGGRRGFTLLAAAAILVVGGAVAAGSGLLRLSTVEPPTPPDALVATPDTSGPSDAPQTPRPTEAPAAALRNGDLIAFHAARPEGGDVQAWAAVMPDPARLGRAGRRKRCPRARP